MVKKQIKEILAAMNTTELVVEIRPESVSQRSWVQIPYGSDFFFFLVLFQLLAKNKSGENLSFFNISSNDLLRSKWIAAIRRDEGPDFEIRVAS